VIEPRSASLSSSKHPSLKLEYRKIEWTSKGFESELTHCETVHFSLAPVRPVVCIESCDLNPIQLSTMDISELATMKTVIPSANCRAH
jgi:hypothetical protein